MLKAMTSRRVRSSGGRFAVVASRYNPRFTDALLAAAEAEIEAGGASARVYRVPGAYEIPVVVAQLLERNRAKLDGVICLGVIIRGQTAHADLIGTAITDALMRLQLEHGTPVIHEVLLLNNEEQAEARCLGKLNRGHEAAQTALAMATLMREIRDGATVRRSGKRSGPDR